MLGTLLNTHSHIHTHTHTHTQKKAKKEEEREKEKGKILTWPQHFTDIIEQTCWSQFVIYARINVMDRVWLMIRSIIYLLVHI